MRPWREGSKTGGVWSYSGSQILKTKKTKFNVAFSCLFVCLFNLTYARSKMNHAQQRGGADHDNAEPDQPARYAQAIVGHGYGFRADGHGRPRAKRFRRHGR